jgi:hypothetical protein
MDIEHKFDMAKDGTIGLESAFCSNDRLPLKSSRKLTSGK